MKWLSAILGLIIGYYAIAIPSCDWLWPNSNLCGIYSPIGALIGAGLGYWLVARMTRPR